MTTQGERVTSLTGASIDALDRLVGLLAGMAKLATVAIAFFISGAMIVGVFLRFVLNSSLIWTDEIASLLLASMMFLVIGLGLHERMHIGVSLAMDRLPLRGKIALDIFVHLVSIGFFVLIGIGGYEVARSSMVIDLAMVPLPRGLFELAIPIGSAFATIVCVNKIVQVATGREIPRGHGVD